MGQLRSHPSQCAGGDRGQESGLAQGRARTPDPGAPDADPVDHRLEADERAAARNRVERARKVAHRAFESEDLGEALDLWAEIFGSSFPAPATSSEKIGGALGSVMFTVRRVV